MGGALVKQDNVGRQVFWAESWQPRHGSMIDLVTLAFVLSRAWHWCCRQAVHAACRRAVQQTPTEDAHGMQAECAKGADRLWRKSGGKAVMAGAQRARRMRNARRQTVLDVAVWLKSC
ncbi:hypothetical protein Pyn_37987 [Prunus yedoensis var. nudiflora]|uniref:Uncharacterized protein n=1 Tax=Prunus yedoensis var. nudiflora TaxID=2094558 RepID=A0A314YVB6_PRUYE|nr:hypothetical protein Pyn_37987 [Prunus yedoensis var. nudiflora]